VGVGDGADKWARAAVLSSVNSREREFLRALLKSKGRGKSEEALVLIWLDLGRVLGAAIASTERKELVHELLGVPERAVNGARAALSGFSETRLETLREVLNAGGPDATKLKQWLAVAREELTEGSTPTTARLRAVQLLAAEGETANGALLACLRPGVEPELVAALARVLTLPGNRAGVRELLNRARWATYAPGTRGAVLTTVLSRPEHYSELLDAVEGGGVPASALASVQREQLKRAKDDAVKQRALNLFQLPNGGDRTKAFESAKACLELKGVSLNGRRVFKNLCAPCHRLDQDGVAVGPDLFDIRNQPKESILLHIIIPEQEIAPNFVNYLCETKDGRVLSGLMAAETGNRITLRQAQGVEETVPRTLISTLTASPLSLMPQEMEKGLTAQELADLLSYLKGE
jgi:putative heme-binding domain-containing protein